MVQLGQYEDNKTARIIEIPALLERAGSTPSSTRFKETELRIEVDQYNGMAHVWQSYEAYHGRSKVMGINSYQLVFQDGRWWIAHLMWASDLNGVKVPKQYLPDEHF